MKFLVEKVSDFLADEQGATAVEYGIFVALVAAVIVVVVKNLGDKIQTAFTTIVSTLP